MYQILIVEDDRGLNQGIALALRQEGVSFLQAYNAAEGRDFWEKGHVDMALLDVNLPDGAQERSPGSVPCHPLRSISDTSFYASFYSDL